MMLTDGSPRLPSVCREVLSRTLSFAKLTLLDMRITSGASQMTGANPWFQKQHEIKLPSLAG